VKWVIGDWGTACGPQPAGGGEGAASVIVHETAGELVLSGGGRVYSTTQCWEQYPGIQRVGHTAASRNWKTTCKTPEGDARQATVSTTLAASDERISFYEAGQYQFVIQGQNCTASVGRYRTYTLVQRATTPEGIASAASAVSAASATASAPASAAPPAKPKPPPAEPRCKTVGPPARLEVRPARKLIRAGEQFEFRAIVSDSHGCVLGAKPTWAIETGTDQGEVSQNGLVKVASGAAEGEMRLTASVAGKSTAVVVEIASTARYDALLKSGVFNAEGEVDKPAAVQIASQSIDAAPAVAKDLASDRKRMFVAFVCVVALALAIGGIVLMRRGRRAKAAPQPAAAVPGVYNPTRNLSSTQVLTPEEAAGGPATMAAGPPMEQGVGGMTIAVPGPGMGGGMSAGLGGGVGGMTVGVGPPEATAARPKPRTICPVCGTEYGTESRFCGKDGVTLVPMN
jgi:hypothetical protein